LEAVFSASYLRRAQLREQREHCSIRYQEMSSEDIEYLVRTVVTSIVRELMREL
jgi:hypothetical protein